MTAMMWLFLAAAMLPFVAAVCAKAGGKGFSNHEPRPWLASLTGWRARANSAQANTFEALPFFFGACLLALYRQVDTTWLTTLMAVWVVCRLLYLAVYIAGYGTVRSLIWTVALGVNIAILFGGQGV